MGLADILTSVLGWLLFLPDWFALLIFGIFMAIIVALAQKFLTDQKRMKELKESIKKHQNELKKHKDDPKKMAKAQSLAMRDNMEYMKMSFRPTLYTLIPLIILFAWMNVHFSYDAIAPGEEFEVLLKMEEPARITLSTDIDIVGESTKETLEKQVKWTLSGSQGVHELTFTTDQGDTATHSVKIGEKPNGVFTLILYTEQGDKIKVHKDPFGTSTIDYPKLHPLGNFSLFGYRPGWLFTYIVIAMAFGIAIRKVLKIS